MVVPLLCQFHSLLTATYNFLQRVKIDLICLIQVLKNICSVKYFKNFDISHTELILVKHPFFMPLFYYDTILVHYLQLLLNFMLV